MKCHSRQPKRSPEKKVVKDTSWNLITFGNTKHEGHFILVDYFPAGVFWCRVVLFIVISFWFHIEFHLLECGPTLRCFRIFLGMGHHRHCPFETISQNRRNGTFGENHSLLARNLNLARFPLNFPMNQPSEIGKPCLSVQFYCGMAMDGIVNN